MFVHDDVKMAIPFIGAGHELGKPFFINLWMHEPHTLSCRPQAYGAIQRTFGSGCDLCGHTFPCRFADWATLDALESNGLTEDTLVIFSSDNGPSKGAPRYTSCIDLRHSHWSRLWPGAAKGITGGRLEYKGSLMEGGIGVPFIARWPGKVPAGVVDKTNIISAVDLLPTFVPWRMCPCRLITARMELVRYLL